MGEVSIREFSGDDFDAYWEWASDPAVTRYLTWEAFGSAGDAREFLMQGLQQFQYFKAVCSDGVVVGSIARTRGAGPRFGTVEIGYVSKRSVWGQGIGSKAIQLAAEASFREPRIVRVQAKVHPDNIGSCRALEKAGFLREGLLRNAFVRKGVLEDQLLYSRVRNKR